MPSTKEKSLFAVTNEAAVPKYSIKAFPKSRKYQWKNKYNENNWKCLHCSVNLVN